MNISPHFAYQNKRSESDVHDFFELQHAKMGVLSEYVHINANSNGSRRVSPDPWLVPHSNIGHGKTDSV